jgi:hypothetical protein
MNTTASQIVKVIPLILTEFQTDHEICMRVMPSEVISTAFNINPSH